MVKRPDNPAHRALMEKGIEAPAAPPSPAARLDAVFGALGSDVRRVLLDRLARGPLAVADLAAAVTVSGPAVSKHLRVLEEAGLVARGREGRTHRIARQDAPLAQAAAWLAAQGVAPPAQGGAPRSEVLPPPAQAPRLSAPPADAWAHGQAAALVAALAPARAVLEAALAPRPAAPAAGPADYLAHVLRRRLGTDELRSELAQGLAALQALDAALAAPDPRAAPDLEALTAGASGLSWLLAQHPTLADLGLLARRPPAA